MKQAPLILLLALLCAAPATAEKTSAPWTQGLVQLCEVEPAQCATFFEGIMTGVVLSMTGQEQSNRLMRNLFELSAANAAVVGMWASPWICIPPDTDLTKASVKLRDAVLEFAKSAGEKKMADIIVSMILVAQGHMRSEFLCRLNGFGQDESP